MFDLDTEYPYLEEVNEGVVRVIDRLAQPGAVLDVGCGRGALGAAIRQKGYEVHGIERSEEAVAIARGRLDAVYAIDILDAHGVEAALGARRFDYVIFSDVLEHLPDPLSALVSYSRYLAPRGYMVISVPNVANWDQRMRLLGGRFNYAETGVMDKTHLRFFTFASARRLLEEAGLAVELADHTPHLVRAALPLIKRVMGGGKSGERSIIDSPAYRLYERYVYPAEYALSKLRKELFAFRIVFAARRREAECSPSQ